MRGDKGVSRRLCEILRTGTCYWGGGSSNCRRASVIKELGYG